MLLCAFWVLFHFLGFYTVSGASCDCSSVVIPVHVDVLVPKDPTDEFAGLKSNASSLRRVDDTYDIFGVFCRPDVVSPGASVVQLLVHGFTYTNQYWSPPVEEFPELLLRSFLYPTVAAAVSQVAFHLKTASIVSGVPPFKKVIGIGHSAGSGLLNFNAIVDGPQSIFDGLILTGSLSVPPDTLPPPSTLTPAQDDTPLRWGTLDPGYVTTSNRSMFYPADTTAFSPRMIEFDDFTKDVGTVSIFEQTAITSLTAQYTGPVVKIVGSEDQLFCTTGRCVNVTALTASERVGWPAARSFEVVVEQGNGHDMNLDFKAQGPFNTFVSFVNQFSGL
ncbi:Alpha/beta hydrolase family-domain-containing protein [Mycena sanguinolenta]|uniref:Alpha/beta hydrolase family-domain-containing protein n=1 Tax=Mycena sanguinolenta TaxID=230812 RepID=A0A8H7DMN3_9AGAR|nr:Alpha/beta hydrolase family-domain-containing protein [Mycena sanguinolenta]